MRDLFTNSKPVVVKRLLSMLIKEIVINGEDVKLVGQPAGLMGLLETGSKKKSTPEVKEVLNSYYNWQPVCGIIKYFSGHFQFQRKANKDNILRFNPVKIGEWLEALLPKNLVSKDTAVVALADKLGISRTRTIQFLNLMRIPADLRGRLEGMPDLTEARLRPMVQMDPVSMRASVGRLLGLGTMAKVG